MCNDEVMCILKCKLMLVLKNKYVFISHPDRLQEQNYGMIILTDTKEIHGNTQHRILQNRDKEQLL